MPQHGGLSLSPATPKPFFTKPAMSTRHAASPSEVFFSNVPFDVEEAAVSLQNWLRSMRFKVSEIQQS